MGEELYDDDFWSDFNCSGFYDPNCSELMNLSQFYMYYYEYSERAVLPEAIIVPLINGLIFIVGLTGNTLVVYVVIRNGAMKTVTNLYLVNLAIADLMFLVFCVPFTTWMYIYPNWMFGEEMCKFVNYLMVVTMAVSVMTLTVMGVDRYHAVVFPVRSRVYRTFERAVVVIGIIWVAAFMLLLPIAIITRIKALFDHGGQKNFCHEYWPVEAQRRAYTIIVFVLLYCLPLSIIVVCYLLMAKNLWMSISPAFQESNHAALKAFQARRRVAKMVLVVVIIFGLCWLPIHIVHIRNDFGMTGADGGVQIIDYVFKIFAHCMSYANSAVNPLVYSFLSENFRKCFRMAFICCEKKPRNRRIFTLMERGDVQSTGTSSSSRATPNNKEARIIAPPVDVKACSEMVYPEPTSV
ncbi:galanin receptor type 1-like [Tubulanus polymorphus]|uniref:galanin receptor type 1-like n=1 Tax=Tubulanus polymorphus TaxID=672921 RepID=UPI003DA31738